MIYFYVVSALVISKTRGTVTTQEVCLSAVVRYLSSWTKTHLLLHYCLQLLSCCFRKKRGLVLQIRCLKGQIWHKCWGRYTKN